MEDNLSTAALMDSTASKIQQLQKAFAELESHRAVTLNLKWKQIEEHFRGLQKSLKRRFTELEEQEKEFETKTSESRKILEERKAAIAAKEQNSLQNLQEKRDAAVSAILTAMEKPIKPFALPPGVTTSDNLVEAPFHDPKTPPAVVTAMSNIDAMRKPAENVKVKCYPDLVKLCQEMNSEGLHKFISDNRKDLVTLRDEIPIALKAASNPAFLVLDSLKGFYGSGISGSDAKKDSNLLGLRRSCIMLLECLFSLSQDVGVNVVSDVDKQRAKTIAEEWKPKLGYLDMDDSNGNSLEAHAFLQLVASFGINSDFDQEFLSGLIPMVSRRRQTAELCRHLGLSEKMPGVIEVLLKNGRHIDAVNLAFAFELTNQFSPVSMLKSYISEAKRISSTTKSGNSSPTSSAQNDGSEKELSAVKAVIKCIEDHKLEGEFPTDPLYKQVSEMEKAKADKKRGTEVAKPQLKRPRANVAAAVTATASPPAPHPSPRASPVAANTTIDNSFRYPHPQYMYYPNHHRHHHMPSYMPMPMPVPMAAYTTYPPPPSVNSFFGYQYQYQAVYLQ